MLARKGLLVGVGGLVLLGVGIGVGLFLTGAGTSHASTSAGSATQAAWHDAPALTTGQAKALAGELRSGSATQVATAVALPAGQALPASFLIQLHGLRSLVFDPGSFRTTGAGTATVTATTTGPTGTTSSWQLVLVFTAGKWRVATTTRTAS